MAQAQSNNFPVVGGVGSSSGGGCGCFGGWAVVCGCAHGLVGWLWCVGGGDSCGIVCAWLISATVGNSFEFCDNWLYGVGNGQDRLDCGDVGRCAKVGFAVELVGVAGWLCGDDEGVLGGHVAAPSAPEFVERLKIDELVTYGCC